MIAIAILLAAQAALADPALPADLAQIPPLPWRTPPVVAADVAAFVADEVRAGRCALSTPIDLDFAVLVRSDGSVRRIVPRAIGCATVEQYGAGVVTSLARGRLRAATAGWYRATLTIAWSR